MKKGPLLGVGVGALLVVSGVFALVGRHTQSASTVTTQPDPCSAASPDKRPDHCTGHGHSSGGAYIYSNWPDKRASGHDEGETGTAGEAESAGHAGFGEGAAAHAGGGGE